VKALRNWFRVENKSDDPTVAEIHIIDIIGDWVDELINDYYGMTATVTAKAFVKQLADLPDAVKTIRVHLNTPGGDVFAALNIANALREQQTSKGRTVETIVDGLAASAGSIILMAGSKVTIADNAMVMVHNPWSVAVGNAADMRKAAATLDAVRNTIVATYRWHSTLDDAALIALLDAETWMDADEALANGFATDKIDGLKAAASIDGRIVAKLNVPERFKARVDALLKPEPQPPTAAAALDVVRACNAAGCQDEAEGLIARGATAADVTAHLATAKARKAAAATRTTEIRALCKAASLESLADGYVAGGMSASDVRAHLTTITARLDTVEIEAGLHPDKVPGRTGAVDRKSIYAKFNKG
jgi:ATP-dependent protease ClpP protease subunit